MLNPASMTTICFGKAQCGFVISAKNMSKGVLTSRELRILEEETKRVKSITRKWKRECGNEKISLEMQPLALLICFFIFYILYILIIVVPLFLMTWGIMASIRRMRYLYMSVLDFFVKLIKRVKYHE